MGWKKYTNNRDHHFQMAFQCLTWVMNFKREKIKELYHSQIRPGSILLMNMLLSCAISLWRLLQTSHCQSCASLHSHCIRTVCHFHHVSMSWYIAPIFDTTGKMIIEYFTNADKTLCGNNLRVQQPNIRYDSMGGGCSLSGLPIKCKAFIIFK